jgi:hypothetical protein
MELSVWLLTTRWGLDGEATRVVSLVDITRGRGCDNYKPPPGTRNKLTL